MRPSYDDARFKDQMNISNQPAFLWRGAVAAFANAVFRIRPARLEAEAAKSSKRIGMLGNFGTGNTGNESTLAAMLQTLRKVAPQASVTCVCYAPGEVERDHCVRAVPLNPMGPRNIAFRIFNRLLFMLPVECIRILKMLAVLRRMDVLIIPGTGSLDDFGVPPFDWPFHLFKWCVAAKLMGIKVGFASAGAGPIANRLSRRFLKLAAGAATYRSFRDEHSREFVKSLGLDTSKDPIFPDLVFSLDRALPATKPSRGSRCVGVGIMSYRGWNLGPDACEGIYEGYLSKICSFVLWLRSEGWDVRLFGGDAVDDRALADLTKRIEARAEEPVAAWLTTTRAYSRSQLLFEIGQSDRIVATRFHNVLWSLMMQKPVISVGYAEKNRLLMREMGFGEYCHDIESFEVSDLIRNFNEFSRDQNELASGLAKKIEACRLALARQEIIIASQLLGAK